MSGLPPPPSDPLSRANARAISQRDRGDGDDGIRVVSPAVGAGVGTGFPWSASAGAVTHEGTLDATAGGKVRLAHTCTAEVLMTMDQSGNGAATVIGCSGTGWQLTKDGLQEVQRNPETGEIEPVPGAVPLGKITVNACVDGVDKTLVLMGFIVE
jgi:hypothetical protein